MNAAPILLFPVMLLDISHQLLLFWLGSEDGNEMCCIETSLAEKHCQSGLKVPRSVAPNNEGRRSEALGGDHFTTTWQSL